MEIFGRIRISLSKDSWCSIDGGELFVNGMHISPYEQGNIFNRDPDRKRRLLMHRKQIDKLFGTLKTEGLTLIPLSAYFRKGKLKIQVGLCKGKKIYDKRESMARRDAEREKQRALRERSRY